MKTNNVSWKKKLTFGSIFFLAIVLIICVFIPLMIKPWKSYKYTNTNQWLTSLGASNEDKNLIFQNADASSLCANLPTNVENFKTIKPHEFYDNAKNVGASDVIVYYINNVYSDIGVFYKFGTILHIFTLLQQNPNQEIYFYTANDDLFNKISLIKTDFNKPNIHVKKISDYFVDTSYRSNTTDVIQDMSLYGKDRKKRFYIADLKWLNLFWNYDKLINSKFDISQEISKINSSIYDDIYPLIQIFDEINILPDGFVSSESYSNKCMDLFQKIGQYCDWTNDVFSNSDFILSKIKNEGISKEEFNNYEYSGAFLLSLLFIKTQYNNTIWNNYFFPSLDIVHDVNQPNIPMLTDKTKGYFSPYNCKNVDVIYMYSQLNDDFKSQFAKVFFQSESSTSLDEYKNEMNNHYNVIYTGTIFVKANADNPEAQRMALLAYNALKNDRVPLNQLQVWFKGHPRQEGQPDDYKGWLKEDIVSVLDDLKNNQAIDQQILDSLINSVDQWCKFLPIATPFEYYVFNGFLGNDPTKNKVVQYYSMFSTILCYLKSDATTADAVIKVLVSPEFMDYIDYYFYPEGGGVVVI